MSYFVTLRKSIIAAIGSASFKFSVHDVPANVVEWITAHPGQSALIIVQGVIIFSPAALTGPILGALGFGTQGPIAGSVAAWLQATMGNIGAGGVFASCQSAAMGGYGAPIVNGVAQAFAGIGGAATAWWPRKP